MAAGAKGGKEKGEKKEKEEKPKAEKPVEKPKKEEKSAEDLMDELEKPAPKPKGPLDLLPATPMDLDTVKRTLWSVRPIKADYLDELFDSGVFDEKGWSWWTCHYNYNNENNVLYMTGNLVGGFIQRSDACRKYALGVVNITGNEDEETPPFKVCGVWMWRGLDFLPPMKEENPDSEYYTWKKLDPKNNSADRQILKDMFLADKVEGEKVLDRRFFK